MQLVDSFVSIFVSEFCLDKLLSTPILTQTKESSRRFQDHEYRRTLGNISPHNTIQFRPSTVIERDISPNLLECMKSSGLRSPAVERGRLGFDISLWLGRVFAWVC